MFPAVLLGLACLLCPLPSLPHLPSLPKRICSFVDNGDNQTVFDKMARACGRRGERRDDSGVRLALGMLLKGHLQNLIILHLITPVAFRD